MIKIRLQRKGVIKKAFYRIVATPEEAKGTASPVEILGYWQPSKDLLKLDKKALESWVGKGAQITPAVKKLLEK